MGEVQYKPGGFVPGTKYRVVSLLGIGGYGEVYVAKHTFTEATVSLKLLAPALAENADVVRRMHVEAKTLARLAHKNIVAVTDGGFTEEARPRPYVVMELLKGASLEELLARNPRGLGLRSSLKILPDALDGLAVAHDNGIIHRDLKPANIFIHTAPTGETYPKLLDFGIAHLVSERRVTGEMYLGTPKWSAPEQLAGKRPTTQTDLYSMGLVLFHCLCGRGPFDDLGDAAAIMRAHLKRVPPPISAFVQGMPPELERLVKAMLAKEPSDRPNSAALVAKALRKLLLQLEAAYEIASYSPASQTEPTPMQFNSMAALASSRGKDVTFPDAPQSRRIVAAAEAETGFRGPLGPPAVRTALPPPVAGPQGRGHTVRIVSVGPTPYAQGYRPRSIEIEDKVYMPLEAFLPPSEPRRSLDVSPTPPAALSISTQAAPPVTKARAGELIRKYAVIGGGFVGVLFGLVLIAIFLAFQHAEGVRAERRRGGAASTGAPSDTTSRDAAAAR
jgi:serine/threonine-protein kinase